MKLFKFGLRIWITVSSVAIFLVGWIMLGHSPKPINPSAVQVYVTPLPTLSPLPPMPGFDPREVTGVQPNVQNNRRNLAPLFFLTGGS